MKMNDSYDIISQIDETESAADDFNVDIFTSQTDMERELIMNHIKGDSILESFISYLHNFFEKGVSV